jgi:phage FluMu protein Com
MLNKWKSLFENRCPKCNELLSVEKTTFSLVKACPQGHYKEETYAPLGVRIMYDSSESQE